MGAGQDRTTKRVVFNRWEKVGYGGEQNKRRSTLLLTKFALGPGKGANWSKVKKYPKRLFDHLVCGHESCNPLTFLGSSVLTSVCKSSEKKSLHEGYLFCSSGMLVVIKIGIISIMTLYLMAPEQTR